MQFKRYEIEERKYSSNGLIGIEELITLTGELKEKKHFLFSFYGLKKAEADIEIERLKNFYNGDQSKSS